jgi:hypothetical protein
MVPADAAAAAAATSTAAASTAAVPHHDAAARLVRVDQHMVGRLLPKQRQQVAVYAA